MDHWSKVLHTHTNCYTARTYTCIIKVPKDLLLFNLVNFKTYKSVCVLTTIFYLNKFHVYEIVILFDIMSRSK